MKGQAPLIRRSRTSIEQLKGTVKGDGSLLTVPHSQWHAHCKCGSGYNLDGSIKALSLTIEDKETFFAVSSTAFDLFAEQGILMPNIFVYPAPGSADFLTKIQARHKSDSSTEMAAVKKHFSRCNIESIFEFYESRFYDSACGEDIVRVYAVLK
jgi:hypothetical protein